MKTLWVVGGGIEAIPGIQRAKAMGLYVVVSDGNLQAPGFTFADHSCVVSTYDVQATVAAALDFHKKKRPLNGVICIASDIPHTVAAVASALNLPGIPLEMANIMMDKVAMKDYFALHHIPIPWYQALDSVETLKRIIWERGNDLVIKPVDSRGARGVLHLSASVDLTWAFEYAKQESPTGRVMVEQFLPGAQVSTESLVQNGTAYTLGFADRNYELLERYAPHMIENGGDLPGHLAEAQKKSVRDLIQRVVDAMKMENGVIKGDIVIYNHQATVIEVAPRLSGGYFCTHEIPLNTGIDFVGSAISLALGNEIPESTLIAQYDRPVCQRYLFTEPGKVMSIEGFEQVARRPDIAFCEIRVQVGDVIPTVSNHLARPGVVIATGATAIQAKNNAENAISDISIKILSENKGLEMKNFHDNDIVKKITWQVVDAFRGGYSSPSLTQHRPCPLCHSVRAKTVFSLDNFQFFSDSSHFPKRTDIKQQSCLDCATLFMNPAYSSYGFEIVFQEAGLSYGGSERTYHEQVSWLEKKNLLYPGNLVLDVGCYEGKFLTMLPKEVRCIGIDMDEMAIIRARQQNESARMKFEVGNFENYFYEEQPDIITMFHLLEHLPDPVLVLKQLLKNSKENTKLIVEVPILEQGLTSDICGFFSVQHLTHFSKRTLHNCLLKSGWLIIEEHACENYNGYRVIASPNSSLKDNISRDFPDNDVATLNKVLSNWHQSIIAVEEKISDLHNVDKLVIWGGGQHIETLYQTTSLFRKFKTVEMIIIDLDPIKQGKTWRGIPIYDPSFLNGMDWHSTKLLVSSYGSQNAIIKDALGFGVPGHAIVKLYDEVHSY